MMIMMLMTTIMIKVTYFVQSLVHIKDVKNIFVHLAVVTVYSVSLPDFLLYKLGLIKHASFMRMKY